MTLDMETPEKRARLLRQVIAYEVQFVSLGTIAAKRHFERLAAFATREAEEAARREEREATLALCQRIMSHIREVGRDPGLFEGGRFQVAEQIAAAIRARREE